jgi:hypothetical protein
MHKAKTKQKISEQEPHPISGVSWQILCRIALRGDLKGRQTVTFSIAATNAREKLGITLKEAIKLYS